MSTKPILMSFTAAGAGLLLMLSGGQPAAGAPAAATAGSLSIIDRDGGTTAVCPLKHTDVQAEISGFLARVNVTQEFENPTGENVEAVYVFPLPEKAAVDDMTMLVGDRTIKGIIKPRDEARKIYEQARERGQTASLLDQERPNIFTQSVTNIGPGMKVKVLISYVEILAYEKGTYEFSFPMVVGPRYMPKSGAVTDAGRISPPVAKPPMRAGHDISLKVSLDAGVPLEGIRSTTHEIDLTRPDGQRAELRLRDQSSIPNKDFILRYDVAGGKIQDALLTHRGARGGFFTFLLQPPERVAASEVTPKELVFVVDTSGSMSGFPIEKSKELIKLALDGLNPRDTFNLITFAGDTHILFPQPVPATAANVQQAQRFLLSRSGGGGTEMMKAIRAALDPSDQQDHVRIVCFLTDGYVGNDMEVIGEVKRHPNARVFSFGIGSSVNRFLLDKMAEEGRGEVEYVGLNDDGSAAAKRLYERVRNPLLTDITIDWGGLPVTDVYPQRIPDLFSAKPLTLTGRFTGPAQGVLRVRGKMAGRDVVREVRVNLPSSEPEHDVLATLWARTRVDNLMSQDWNGMQAGRPQLEIQQEITRLGLKYHLMTQFTSFVAVEESTVVEGGKPKVIQVPVEIPHGVSYEGIFGERQEAAPAIAIGSAAGGVIGGFATSASPMPRMVRPAAPPVPREQPSRSDEEKDAASAKLDPQLATAAHAAASGASTAQYRFVAGGKAQVKIWLLDDSAAVISELKKLGVEVTAQRPGKQVLGRIALEKLAALAELKAVLFVSPDLGQP